MIGRRHIVLIAFLFTGLVVIAQKQRRDKYWIGGFNIGAIGWSPTSIQMISGTDHFTRTMNYGLGNVTDVDGHKHLSFLANTSIGLHGGFMWFDRDHSAFTSIETEIQNNKACYEFNSPFSMAMTGSPDSATQWVESDKYLKASMAVQRGWLLNASGDKSYWYIRESFGQTFFHRNFEDVIRLHHTEDWTVNGSGMKSEVTSVNQSSYMLASEIGVKAFTSDNSAFDIGLVYYSPFQKTFTERDEFFKDGQSTGNSTITYGSGTVMFNLRYTVGYHLKNKPVDTTKVRQPVNHKVNGRNVHVQNTMNVDVDLITVRVWDRGRVDGDKIALYLNGELLLDDYTLTKEKKEIELHLKPGVNYLAMHAINVGTIPPNTASMEIGEGKKKKNFTVISDTGKTGAIEIIYTP